MWVNWATKAPDPVQQVPSQFLKTTVRLLPDCCFRCPHLVIIPPLFIHCSSLAVLQRAEHVTRNAASRLMAGKVQAVWLKCGQFLLLWELLLFSAFVLLFVLVVPMANGGGGGQRVECCCPIVQRDCAEEAEPSLLLLHRWHKNPTSTETHQALLRTEAETVCTGIKLERPSRGTSAAGQQSFKNKTHTTLLVSRFSCQGASTSYFREVAQTAG